MKVKIEVKKKWFTIMNDVYKNHAAVICTLDNGNIIETTVSDFNDQRSFNFAVIKRVVEDIKNKKSLNTPLDIQDRIELNVHDFFTEDSINS